MVRVESQKCQHCGALGADAYANDGAIVCAACAAYDQIVSAELRLSQSDLHVLPTGDADHLVESAKRAARARIIAASVVLACAVVTLAFGYRMPLAYVAAGVGSLLALILYVDARRLRQFAKLDAPEIERRAVSSQPQSMFDPSSSARV